MPIFALKSCPKSNKLPNLVTPAFTHLYSKTEHNIPIFLCRVLNILQIVSNVPNCGETARANACVNKTTDQCDQIWQNFTTMAKFSKSLANVWLFIFYLTKCWTNLLQYGANYHFWLQMTKPSGHTSTDLTVSFF